jgi:hypothetical protein
MYLAKFGIISTTGTVAKMTASHDYSTYSQNYALLRAAHQLGRDASTNASDDVSSHEAKNPQQ